MNYLRKTEDKIPLLFDLNEDIKNYKVVNLRELLSGEDLLSKSINEMMEHKHFTNQGTGTYITSYSRFTVFPGLILEGKKILAIIFTEVITGKRKAWYNKFFIDGLSTRRTLCNRFVSNYGLNTRKDVEVVEQDIIEQAFFGNLFLSPADYLESIQKEVSSGFLSKMKEKQIVPLEIPEEEEEEDEEEELVEEEEEFEGEGDLIDPEPITIVSGENATLGTTIDNNGTVWVTLDASDFSVFDITTTYAQTGTVST